jgi:hypothetical protein
VQRLIHKKWNLKKNLKSEAVNTAVISETKRKLKGLMKITVCILIPYTVEMSRDISAV